MIRAQFVHSLSELASPPDVGFRPGKVKKSSGVRAAHREVAERNGIAWKESMGKDYFQCPTCLDWVRLPKKAMHHCTNNVKVKP